MLGKAYRQFSTIVCLACLGLSCLSGLSGLLGLSCWSCQSRFSCLFICLTCLTCLSCLACLSCLTCLTYLACLTRLTHLTCLTCLACLTCLTCLNFKHLCFSLIFQAVFVMLPGRQPLQYYLCLNLSHSTLSDNFKMNWSFLLLQAISFAIHIFVNVKVKMLKAKQTHSTKILTQSHQLKLGDLLTMESRSISDYLTSFLCLTASSSVVITTSIINWINPIKLNKVIL